MVSNWFAAIKWSRFLPLLLLAALLSIAAFSSYTHLKSLYFDRVEENLRGQIGTLSQSLSGWGRSKRNYVYSWAKQPELVARAKVIINGRTDEIRKLSRFSLADYLRPVISDAEITNFYLIDSRNKIVASSAEQLLFVSGHTLVQPDLLQQVWKGMTVITHPIRRGQRNASIYVAAAVKEGGRAMAILVLEIDPTVSFNEVFKKSAFSKTGEAYAFSRDGLMLTPSRQLEYPIDDMQPSGSQTLLGRLESELESVREWPVQHTPLAGRVGQRSFDLYVREQFMGHDDTLKIGAWIWDAQFQMGIALEQSATEGLQLLRRMQWVFLSFLVLVVVISCSFFFILSYWSVQRSRKEQDARQALTSELESLHKKNTLEIADREARYRATIDTAWDAIFTVDEDGVIQSGNPATCRIFACDQRKLEGCLLEDWIHLDHQQGFSVQVLTSSSGQTLEATGVRRDRSLFPVAVSIARTETSQSCFYTVIVRDNSQQKAAEASLRRAQQRLEMSQAFAYIGTWEWDVRNDRVLATEMALKLNGLSGSLNQISLGAFFSGLENDDRRQLNDELNQALRSQQPFSVECRISRKASDKAQDWLLIQGTPLAEQGVARRVIGHIQLITESKESEQALEQARYMLRLVLDTIPTGVYWKDTELKIAGVNKRFCEDIGLPEEQIIGRVERDIYINREQALLVERLDRSVVESGLPIKTQNGRYYMNDGSLRHIEISRLPIQDEACHTLGMLGIYSDITERLETQSNLQKHHRQLAFIYSAQLRYFSGDGRDEIFSVLLEEILGLTESAFGFVGEVLYDRDNNPYLKTFSVNSLGWHKEGAPDPGMHPSVLEFTAQDGLIGYALRHHELVISNDPSRDSRAKGLPPWHGDMTCFMGIPLLKGEHLVGMIGIANRADGYSQEMVNFLQPMFTTCANLIAAMDNDAKIIATQRQLLRAKNQAEKASRAKTEFLSRVSHELRTPMNAIIGFADLLSDVVSGDEPQSFLAEIEHASQHLMGLINEVLDLERIEAGRIELQVDRLSLPVLLSECLTVVSPLAAQRNVQLELAQAPENLPDIATDAARLKQVLLNLISNAIKYNRPDGRVEIGLQQASAQVVIEVKDTGIGLSDDELEHLFESFNRLHAENSDIEGTGMGLVITRRLVELMGGSLSVESEKGVGSCFRVTLPCHSDSGEGISGLALNPSQVPYVLVLSSQSYLQDLYPALEAELMNYEVDLVSTGIAFLEACLQKQYQLLIVDVSVADFSLDELLAYLVDAEALQATPLLLVAEPGQKEKFAAYGLGEGIYTQVSLCIKDEPDSFAIPRLSLSE